MKELVIGADGYIGSRLKQITEAEGTSRRNPLLLPSEYFLDLGAFEDSELPEADIVYICAGVNGAQKCEGSQLAYRVNVDATIRIAEHYRKGFVVWISSTSIEWANTSYARQKQTTESHLRTLPWVGIVRAGRVVNSNLDSLCEMMMHVGRARRKGVHLWGIDERPYDK